MTDEDGIRQAVLDYFEGWFDGDADRMERALHPQLAKRSLGNGALDEDTAPQMIEATAQGRGRRRDPGERRIDIDVVEVHGPIATVVVYSNVYREYLHLGRMEEGWKIVNTLWDWA
jgi:hypothetical protein